MAGRPAPSSIEERDDRVALTTGEVEPGRSAYLGHLLCSALTAPGAAASPIAGRVIAVLMTALAAQGDEDVVAPYLSPDLSDRATFTVRSYRFDRAEPLTVSHHRGAAEALAAVSLIAASVAGTDQHVEVWSHGGDEVARRALSRSASAELTFLFPEAAHFAGDPGRCADALRRWTEAADQQEGASDASVGVLAPGDELAAARHAAPDVPGFLREALADLTVRVDLAEVVEVVNAGLGGATQRLASSLRPASPDDIVHALAPLVPTAAEVADLVTERVTHTIGNDLRRLGCELSEQIDRAAAGAFGPGSRDADAAVDNDVERTVSRLIPRSAAAAGHDLGDGRNDALRSRSRRRKRQSNSSAGGPWATGPSEG